MLFTKTEKLNSSILDCFYICNCKNQIFTCETCEYITDITISPSVQEVTFLSQPFKFLISLKKLQYYPTEI